MSPVSSVFHTEITVNIAKKPGTCNGKNHHTKDKQKYSSQKQIQTKANIKHYNLNNILFICRSNDSVI